MLGEMGNLLVKVGVLENPEERPMMANTELLEAWVSSGKANSGKSGYPGVPGKWGYPGFFRVSRVDLELPELS
jgi:hypothetical protein